MREDMDSQPASRAIEQRAIKAKNFMVGGSDRSGRLLLREAVQSAEPPNEVIAIDRNDFPIFETVPQNFAYFGVALLLLKLRHENGPVYDQKIGVARR